MDAPVEYRIATEPGERFVIDLTVDRVRWSATTVALTCADHGDIVRSPT
jgi:hypothetical protein